MSDKPRVPDAPAEGDERIDLYDDSGKHVGIADVGLGHPDNPYRGQLLSLEDEQRLDERGREVVSGLPWSKTKTGLWLTIAAGRGALSCISPAHSGTSFAIPERITKGSNVRLFIGTFRDSKPRFGTPICGACLELPSDLGQDEIKRKYVTEWIAHTVVESLAGVGIAFDMGDETLGEEFKKLAVMSTWAAEDAIRDSGL